MAVSTKCSVQRFNGLINGGNFIVRFGLGVVLPVRLVTHRDAENFEAAMEGVVGLTRSQPPKPVSLCDAGIAAPCGGVVRAGMWLLPRPSRTYCARDGFSFSAVQAAAVA